MNNVLCMKKFFAYLVSVKKIIKNERSFVPADLEQVKA